MTIVEFLQDAGLNVTKHYGDEIVAYCPWHDDRNASLAINVNGKGWHCFNGCGKGRNLQSLLDKLQPKVNLYQQFLDLFPELYITHSLSYQAYNLSWVLLITMVESASIMLLRGSVL